MKFTIGKKIALGSAPLVIVIVMITWVALGRLDDAHAIFTDIVTTDIALKNHAGEMVTVLRERESKVLRYLILQSDEMLELLDQRNKEYDGHLKKLLPLIDSSKLKKLNDFNAQYRSALEESIKELKSITPDSRQLVQYDSLRTDAYLAEGELLQQIEKEAVEQQSKRTKQAVEIISQTRTTVFIVATTGLLVALVLGHLLISLLLRSVKKLKNAAAMVARGEFKDLPSVTHSDELGELSRSFNVMAGRLIELEEAYKDASPLTRLPGGIAVETVTQTRIEQKIPFAFLMLDLDNFKPFNDRYGYSRGNQVIKHTAEIIKLVSEKIGGENDFVGHIGGDDFVIITEPEKLEIVCSAVISHFDNDITTFYDDDDYQNGRIISVSRRGETQEFPIMTISISAVNSLESELNNFIQVGEIIAELKKYAKGFSGSNFVVDRRH